MSYKPQSIVPCVLCGERAVARKLCRPHWHEHKKKGTLDQFQKLGPQDVFHSRYAINEHTQCWEWMGTKNGYGYGIILMPGERPVRAHRFSYELHNGAIPEGKIVMHTCDNPPCVNPEHLRVGTKDDNNKDTATKRRHNYGLDHWNGRLSDADVAAIRASTERQSVLAKRYGVHQSHISKLKSNGRR